MIQSVAACGTPAGYAAHRRDGEQACDPCLAAKRSYVRQQRGQHVLPPRACPMCLVGACHACTGRLRVLNAAGLGRDEACEHQHPDGTGPADRVLAAIPDGRRSA